MPITIKLIDKISVVQRRVNKALAQKMNDIIINKRLRLLKKMKTMIRSWVSAQPEMKALSSGGVGSLAAEVGLPAGSEHSTVMAIVDSIVDSTHIDFKKIDSKLNGGLILKCQLESFSNLLSLPEGVVLNTGMAGSDLPWLEWLLTAGNKVIVVGYHYDPVSGWGRSRGGIMLPGNSWRIPPQYAGDAEDNFVTRALSNKERQIQQLFVEELGN